MTDHAENDLFGGLIYQGAFALLWDYSQEPGDQELAVANEANQVLLRLLTHQGEPGARGEEDASAFQAELERIDLKLNLLLDLTAGLIREQLNLPPAVPVKLGATAVEWRSLAPPQPDRWLRVRIFVDPVMPRPLEVYGRGVARDDGAGPNDSPGAAVGLRFAGMSQEVQDELQRLIFRQHRKKIALQRRQ
ncbi:MAG TPA: hypothetical protein DCZ13_01445 [Porticoccaceae bacterium]|nr:hypothetical protein [Porticoccaceae bacterium]